MRRNGLQKGNTGRKTLGKSEEMENAVKSMSVGKVPGLDELTVDIIKVAGLLGMQWLYEILVCIWRVKKILEDRKKGNILT